MSEDKALAVLQLLCEEDAQSIHRVARRLDLGLSELQRVLTALGDDARFDGLALVEQQQHGERTLLRLTERGRALCSGA